uniref:Uncharacterized protein n=1 Tax=Lobelia sp. 2 EBK-2017 TaxID=2010900 RepID=A0A1Z2R3A8_9ASTR|nr:hypothetical protein Lo_spn2Pt0328 [Lobelia sp. 2 EBK-2017]
MIFQSFGNFRRRVTNSFVGGALYSGFRPPLEIFEYPGKGISIYKRPRYILTRKYLCYTKRGTPDREEFVYQVFVRICLQMPDREIIARMLKYFGSWKGEELLTLVKTQGADWLTMNKNFFFQNASYIKSTKVGIWTELQSSIVERTDQRKSVLKIGFWYGAWKRFLFELFSDQSDNLGVITRESLYDSLELKDVKEDSKEKDSGLDTLLESLRAAIEKYRKDDDSDSDNGAPSGVRK